MNIETLKACGINYEKGLARFMDDKELYEMAIGMFPNMTSLADAERAFAAKDYAALYDAVHSMKGACGNLDMTDCYLIASDLSKLLHDGDGSDELIAEKFEAFQKAYRHVLAGIEAAQE